MEHWTETDQTPKVSVICTVYNHEKYIRDTLNGFLIQQTAFPFEVLVHDDASTDNTTTIIREYAHKYPNIIIPIIQTENQYSKGNNWGHPKTINPHIRGKYVALCEGDDYWTDSNKLQKQISYMEANPDCSMTFHTVNYEVNGKVSGNDRHGNAERDFTIDQRRRSLLCNILSLLPNRCLPSISPFPNHGRDRRLSPADPDGTVRQCTLFS